jgi:hypothetical protein
MKVNEDDSSSSLAAETLLTQWLEDKLRLGHVPRLSDMVDHVRREGLKLKRSELLKMLQTNPAYMFNMHQQKKKNGV